MDYGTLRGLFALLILALFIIIVGWSYSKKRKDAFSDIANSIFEEDLAAAARKNSSLNEDNKQETKNNV